MLSTVALAQAVEQVGGNRVGCKNKVTRIEQVVVSRAGDRAVLCELHRSRHAAHGCCPLCGEFCSHGLVCAAAHCAVL